MISTAQGAEGLGAQHGKHLLIAETTGEFMDAVMALRHDAGLPGHLTANARALVTAEFSWDPIGARIERAMGELGLSS